MQIRTILAFVVVNGGWGQAGVAGGQTPEVFEDHHLFDPDGASSDKFGYSVSSSGEVAIIGVPHDDVAISGGNNIGSVFILRFDGTSWMEEVHLFASDAEWGDNFGYSVALIGNVAIIGAPLDDMPGGFDAGSAYVYRFNGTTWVEEAHLYASDRAAMDKFGRSVSISGSPGSEVAIVGAPKDDTTGGIDSGSAYVYRYNGKSWVEEAHLYASDGAAGDIFGNSVSSSSEVAIVGATFDDTAGGFRAGSAYVYRFNGSGWVEEAHLFASDGMMNDNFGWSVSVSGTPGSEATIIGTNGDTTKGGLGAGSAYVYRFNGSTWEEEGHLFASDGEAFDNFGNSVSVSGNVAIIGAYRDSTAGGYSSGSAYVYRFNGSTWREESHLFASGGTELDFFGASVSNSSIFGNEYAIVGSWFGNIPEGIDAGSSYIFDVSVAVCPGDITPIGGDGVVDFVDLMAVLNAFGPCVECPEDITPPGPPVGNGVVNIDDLVAVLNAFGDCP